jgi:predicted transcriptional regulator
MSASLLKSFIKAKRRAAGGKHFYTKSTLAQSVQLEPSGLRFKSLPHTFKLITDIEYQALKVQFAPYMDDEILAIVERIHAAGFR